LPAWLVGPDGYFASTELRMTSGEHLNQSSDKVVSQELGTKREREEINDEEISEAEKKVKIENKKE